MSLTDRIDAPGDSVEALTAKANDLIAAQTRRAPEDGFWLHNRWKTPRPNFLLARYKRGAYVPKNLPLKQLQRFRILIRSSNWLGDAVMSVPAVRAIKKGRPDTRVTILAPEKIAPIWKLVSEVDEILSLPNKSLFSAVRLIGRQKSFDVANIALPRSEIARTLPRRGIWTGQALVTGAFCRGGGCGFGTIQGQMDLVRS